MPTVQREMCNSDRICEAILRRFCKKPASAFRRHSDQEVFDQRGFDVVLVNAPNPKHVPGRKTRAFRHFWSRARPPRGRWWRYPGNLDWWRVDDSTGQSRSHTDPQPGYLFGGSLGCSTFLVEHFGCAAVQRL